jgi:hypothetical protein
MEQKGAVKPVTETSGGGMDASMSGQDQVIEDAEFELMSRICNVGSER